VSTTTYCPFTAFEYRILNIYAPPSGRWIEQRALIENKLLPDDDEARPQRHRSVGSGGLRRQTGSSLPRLKPIQTIRGTWGYRSTKRCNLMRFLALTPHAGRLRTGHPVMLALLAQCCRMPFDQTMEQNHQQRLAASTNTMISTARFRMAFTGRMPKKMPDEEFKPARSNTSRLRLRSSWHPVWSFSVDGRFEVVGNYHALL